MAIQLFGKTKKATTGSKGGRPIRDQGDDIAVGALQEAIGVLKRLIKQARRSRVVASQRVVEVLDRRDGRQADNARARYERRRGSELPVAIRRGPLIRQRGSAWALAQCV
ncbi:MAG: hypothetical protein HYY11_04010 [Candidatus Methylomirabilis oxyfera]|nr:hypothetical protein [Candidatus Methylomirabilis oxyfera]